ncbi:MAG: hypothetical protein ACPGVI_02800 [Crocinitomicaceae bacterium]
MNKILMGVLMTALTLTSCKKEEVTPEENNSNTNPTTENLAEIASATNAANQTVTLYSESSDLTTGYTNLYVKITDASGTNVESATVEYAPLMVMPAMSHTCPVEQPVYNSTTGNYKGAVVFIMASMAGDWSIDVTVNGNPVTFDLTVAEAPTKVVGAYQGTDGESYFISLLRPVVWNVGLNDVEVLIHRRESMMSFPADNDFVIDMVPEMMSMGHGSPNNVSPTLIGNGHYKGVINYTMTGDWRMHMTLSKAGVEIHSDAYLDILF